MNADLIAGAPCGIMALSAFVIHVFSSPQKGRWMPLPEYVRWGFVIAGGALAVRSADFLKLGLEGGAALGRINEPGLLASLAMSYALGALAVYIVHSKLPDHTWARLKWFEGFARQHQGAVPTPVQVVEAVRARGVPAVAPLEGAEAVVREVRRG